MINPFDNIPEEDKKSLLSLLEAITLNYPAGVQVLENENENIIGIVNTGIIQIIRNDYNGDRVLVEEIRQNQVFGTEFSSITRQDYAIYSIAACSITIFEFKELYSPAIKQHRSYPLFMENILKILSEIVLKRNDHIQVLSKKTIRERLLEYFKILSKQQKTRDILLPFTYTELADYLAINRCAMYREMGYLKEEKQIQIKKRQIHLSFEID